MVFWVNCFNIVDKSVLKSQYRNDEIMRTNISMVEGNTYIMLYWHEYNFKDTDV